MNAKGARKMTSIAIVRAVTNVALSPFLICSRDSLPLVVFVRMPSEVAMLSFVCVLDNFIFASSLRTGLARVIDPVFGRPEKKDCDEQDDHEQHPGQGCPIGHVLEQEKI